MVQPKLLILAWLLLSVQSFAQQYPFVHYTPEEGLVNGRVRAAYQDSRGQMYFLTFGGLSVYNGTQFTNYTARNGLAADVVNDVLEMGNDSVWIACNTNKLNYLKGQKIKTFVTLDGFCPVINKLIKTANGNVYAAADEGLFLFRNNRFVRQPFLWAGDSIAFLTSVWEWENFLLIQTDVSLSGFAANFYVYDRRTGRVMAETKKQIGGIAIGPQKQIFISGPQSIEQLNADALRQGIIRYQPLPSKYKNLKPSGLMFFDKQEALWLLYPSKILCVDAAGNTKQFTEESGLASGNFTNIYQDKENIIWITMYGSGVDKLISQNVELLKKINGRIIHSMYADENSDSVYMYTAAKNTFHIFYKRKLLNPLYLPGKAKNFAVKVLNKKMYVSNASLLLLLQKEKLNQLTPTLLYKKENAEGLGEFFFDPYQNIALSATSELVSVLSNKKTFKVPVPFTDQMAFDRQSRLWAASRNGRFYILKINPAQPRNYLQLLHSFRYDSILKNASARSLALDRYKNVWLGTRYDGLFCLQFNKKFQLTSYQQYTLKEGLSDNFITHLVIDKENNIWASTASGLDRIYFDGKRYHIENITRSNHLYKYIAKTFVSRSGTVWSLTTNNEVIRIEKRSNFLKAPPKFFITALKVRDSTVNDLVNKGSFRYQQNTFSVAVASPSFYDEKGIRYSYLLQSGGIHETWSEPSNQATFNFIGLNPGLYTLKLKAHYPGGNYPEKIIEYTFTIHSPWWQTGWFRMAAALLIIGFLIIGSRYYYSRKLERQKLILEKGQAVEKERTRIATDIHDDLGSGLSRIRYLGETIRHKKLMGEDIIPQIEKISVFSDEMIDKMNEIIWALNEKNDSLHAMLSYIRAFAVEYLSEHKLESQISMPDEIPFVMVTGETRRNIFLCVKESLHNIVKHAVATKVTMHIEYSKQLLITIIDNGRGINWNSIRPFSNGMLNTNKRMMECNGTVHYKNEAGTTVMLQLPLEANKQT